VSPPRALCALALAILATGCGDSGDGESKATTTTLPGGVVSSITVTAGDLFLKPKELTAKEGRIEIRYEDTGQLAHNLLIDGVADFKLSVDGEGDEDRGTIALETGTYMLYCDVPGHRAAGMEATLSVS
jgi:uncharacterized cupredoxin-like copper-binding protein